MFFYKEKDFMEVFGGGSRRNKHVSQAQLQKLARGGKKADTIKKLSNHHHEEFEIPETERLLQEANTAYSEKLAENNTQTIIKKLTLWEKIKYFIQRIFYPIHKNK